MNSVKKNNQSARSVPGKNLECLGIRHVWTDCFFGVLPDGHNYGACGIVVGNLNRLSSSGVVPLTAISLNISMKLSAFFMEFRMMVMGSSMFKMALADVVRFMVRQWCLLPTHATLPHIKNFKYQETGKRTRFEATPNAVGGFV